MSNRNRAQKEQPSHSNNQNSKLPRKYRSTEKDEILHKTIIACQNDDCKGKSERGKSAKIGKKEKDSQGTMDYTDLH